VHDESVRRINLHLDEELDAKLAAEAARTGESKAALLRRAARAWLAQQTAADPDEAWSSFTGTVTGVPFDEHHDDEVIYRA
jgi:hypothetical protein